MDVEGRREDANEGREDSHFRSHGDDDVVSLSLRLPNNSGLDSGAVVLLELGVAQWKLAHHTEYG